MGNNFTARLTREFTLEPEHDIRNVHGAPGWHELTTTDPADAAVFLGELYGWTFRTQEVGGVEYRVIMVDGHEVGGIKGPMPGETDVPRWDTYVTVTDVDELAGSAASHGARVVVPPMDLGDAGRMTILVHPSGGKLSAFEYPSPFA